MRKPISRQHRLRFAWGGCLVLLALLMGINATAWATLPNNPMMIPAENFPDGFGNVGGEYRFAISDHPFTLNPFLASQHTASQQVASLSGVTVFPTLMDGFFDEPLRITPSLLEVIEIDDLANPTMMTMRLREGLKWSDGAPMTSHDAEFTFAVHTDARYQDFTAFSSLMISNRFPGFERVDDLTWVYHLPGPVDTGAYLAQLNAMMLLPRHVHQVGFNVGTLTSDDYWNTDYALALPDRIVGAGPFRLVGVEDNTWMFERNPHFWKVDESGTALPYFDIIKVRVVESRSLQLSMFQNGELDRIALSPSDLFTIRGFNDPSIKIEVLEPEFNATADFLTLNQDIGLVIENGVPVSLDDPYLDSLRNLFRKKEFRRALSKAMNRQDLIDNVFLTFAAPIYQLTGLGQFDISGGPGSNGIADRHFPHEFFEHDATAANALLDGLDLPRGTDGVRTFGNSYPASGQRVRISLKTNQENINRTLISGRLADTYRNTLGLEFNFEVVSFDDAIADLLAFQLSGGQRLNTWEAFVIGIGGGSDVSVSLSPLTSNGFLHFYRYSDAFDNLRSSAQQRLDDLWLQQQAIVSEAATSNVGGLPGFVFRSPNERFSLIRELQLLAAELQDNIYTVVEKPIFAYYADRLANVSDMTVKLDEEDYKSILNFFERGFRIRGRPGGDPDITP